MNHNGLLHNYLLLSLDFQEIGPHLNMRQPIDNVHNIGHFELYSYRLTHVEQFLPWQLPLRKKDLYLLFEYFHFV